MENAGAPCFFEWEKRGFWNEETQGDKRKHPYTENCDIVYPVKGGGQKPERLKGCLRFLYAGKSGGNGMDTAAEKEPVFGMDEGKRLNVGRKNEFFEGKMGQTEGNVGCQESESIASERDRLRTMEMAGQLECGEKCGKTATVEAGLGKVGLKSDIWRETAKIGQVERELGCRGSPPAELRDRGTVPAGKNDLKSDTRREQGQTGQLERELGCRGTAPAGENELKSDTRREQGKPGQVERELGCRGSPPAAVADAEEVLAALTRILRGEEEAKTSEVLRAAELLGKQYGLFGDREGAPTEAPKIVMDVPGRGEKK